MNGNLQIISKGLYKGVVDTALPVEVKEYVFTRQKGRKCLLLRFFNTSELNITAIHFWIIQKNSYGEQIHREKILLDNIQCIAGRAFAPSDCFYVQNNCVDFDIEIISVFSGEYEFRSGSGESFVRYSGALNKAPTVNKKAQCVQRTKLNNKVKFTGAILVLAVFLILLAVIWPFFIEEVIPAVKKFVKLVWELFGDIVESFFRKIGELFESKNA